MCAHARAHMTHTHTVDWTNSAPRVYMNCISNCLFNRVLSQSKESRVRPISVFFSFSAQTDIKRLQTKTWHKQNSQKRSGIKIALMGSREKKRLFYCFVRARDKNINESEEIFEVCSGSKPDNGFFYQRYPADCLSEPFIVFGKISFIAEQEKLATLWLFSPPSLFLGLWHHNPLLRRFKIGGEDIRRERKRLLHTFVVQQASESG